MGNFLDKDYRLQVYKLALGKIDSAKDNIWWRRDGLCSLIYSIDSTFMKYSWDCEESPIIEIAKQRTRYDWTAYWFYSWEERKQALINAIKEIENEPT